MINSCGLAMATAVWSSTLAAKAGLAYARSVEGIQTGQVFKVGY